MPKSAFSDELCGPQDLIDDEPSESWGLDRLQPYILTQNTSICRDEKLLAGAYWRLGHALSLARSCFAHGEWSDFLASVKVDPTRASKATAIYQEFPKVEKLKGLSVEAAYAKRQRRQTTRQSTVRNSKAGDKSWWASFKQLDRNLDRLMKKTIEPLQAKGLLPTSARLLSRMQEFDAKLQEIAEAPAE